MRFFNFEAKDKLFLLILEDQEVHINDSYIKACLRQLYTFSNKINKLQNT